MKCITALKSKPRSLAVSKHYMPGLWLCYSLVLIALLSHMLTYSQTHSKYLHEVKSYMQGASLVAQWLRVCLPMQGTRVRALVWEDPTCRGATGPVSHNY